MSIVLFVLFIITMAAWAYVNLSLPATSAQYYPHHVRWLAWVAVVLLYLLDHGTKLPS